MGQSATGGSRDDLECKATKSHNIGQSDKNNNNFRFIHTKIRVEALPAKKR